MLSSFSSNVVLSKVRAMYGRRLTEEDYRNLLASRTVGQVTAYLKSRTVYGRVLAGVSESTVYRSLLEEKLKRQLLEESASLGRYEITIGEHFARYFIQRAEIDEILRILILLQAGRQKDYFYHMPAYLAHHTHIDLTAFSRIRDYDGLLAALGQTEYRRILEPFRPKEGERIDYAAVENALLVYLYGNVLQVIEKNTKGEARRQLFDIFASYADLTNYARIVRLKTFYRMEPDAIRRLLLPYGTIRKRLLAEMTTAENAEGVRSVMERTSIGKRALKLNHSYAGELPRRMNFRNCRHYIYFSTHPSVVLISYILILQVEISNIITIVEGVRYRLDPKEIESMLVKAGGQ